MNCHVTIIYILVKLKNNTLTFITKTMFHSFEQFKQDLKLTNKILIIQIELNIKMEYFLFEYDFMMYTLH